MIYEKESDSPFIALASMDLTGRTGQDTWAADVALMDCGPTEAVTIDGRSGILAADCVEALVEVDQRGNLIWLYRIGDLGWFTEILGTVRLHPEDAIQALPSTSP